MIQWRFILLILSLLCSIVQGQKSASIIDELKDIPSFQYGVSALNDHLPDQAAKRFETARTMQGLSSGAQLEISMRIVECNVRSGKGPLALSLLENKELLKHPKAPYWKAQALAASGQFEKASEAFSLLKKGQPFYNNSLLSWARINQSLGNTKKASEILTIASNVADTYTKFQATILLAEIELDAKNIKQSQIYLNKIPKSAQASTLVVKTYLEGRCHLELEEYTQALEAFNYLQTSPNFISQRIFHGSALAKADTLASSSSKDEASIFLSEFIDQYPDSPLLVTMLERISNWVPINPPEKHPVLTKLKEWSLTQNEETPLGASFLPGTTILQQNSSPSSLRNLEPTSLTPSEFPDLAATSLFYLALLNSTQELPGASTRALTLLAYLRAQYPTHILSQRSLLETAKIQLSIGSKLRSIKTLEILQANVISPQLQQHAAFIQGQLEADQENWEKAREAFTKASESLNQDLATAALINAGSAALREGNLDAFDERYSKISDKELRIQLALEKALWMHANSHPEARTALDQFLKNNHDHPRHTEVRLALAAACIESQPIESMRAETELQLAKESIDTEHQIYEFSRIKIQLAELGSQWEEVIQTAARFLEENPSHPDCFNMTLRMGEAMMKNGEFNQARQILGKLAINEPDHPLTIYATFFNAMAARGENTPQSLLESVEIFQKVTESKHPLAEESVIQQARILIDMDQLDRAEAILEASYLTASSSPIKQDLGILLADTYRRKLGDDPSMADKAVAIYTQLLKEASLSQSSINRLHSFLGETYESINRLNLALDIYLSVINGENVASSDQPTQEWHWYYECAFDALTILQEEEQWRSAVAIAKRIASTKGPRSAEAKALAHELSIKHMIWEED